MPEEYPQSYEWQSDTFDQLVKLFTEIRVVRTMNDQTAAARLQNQIGAQFEAMDYPGLRELYIQACVAYRANADVRFSDETVNPAVTDAWTTLHGYLEERFAEACIQGGELFAINAKSLQDQAALSAGVEYGPVATPRAMPQIIPPNQNP
ncbi:MAG TPA: hypothetical protein VJR27_01955 [Candidatus Saccharimonadales bacterium]|nr:hypothetical protein [Candidatus Saccharimonadales bacterium]